MEGTNEIGIIILAAGSSSRLGEPKQLMEFDGQTLLARTIQVAIDSKYHLISIVLGANSEIILNNIKNFPVQICFNDDWQSGMSSSLQIGLQNLLKKNPKLRAIVVLLCDQPLIETKHIIRLIQKFKETNKPIIATQYRKTSGVPALFANKVFDKLMLIQGDKGARKIIEDFPELVETIKIPEADFDIDTAEDVGKLREYFKFSKH